MCSSTADGNGAQDVRSRNWPWRVSLHPELVVTYSKALPAQLKEKVISFGEQSYGAHHVDLVISDGSIVEDVILAWASEVVRVAGVDVADFDASDVVDVIDHRCRG